MSENFRSRGFNTSGRKVSQRIIETTSSSSLKTMENIKISKIFCLCLAVILISPLPTSPNIQSISAQRQDYPHHIQHGQQSTSLMASGSSSSSQIIKDLSGPTSGKIQTLDVICGKNFMTVRAEFSGPFYGLVFSKGTYGQENCIYVKPNSGLTHAAFNVYYDQCGTKPDLQGKFYENTIVIQYGSDIIEAYDEAKRLRCEWFEAYEKPATFKPAIPVADLEVVEMNFQGDDIDCWMEIQEGTGPWSREVAKIVPVGQPMTIVVAINDYNGQFDMRVKSCVAHDGVQQPIALTDEYGCVLRPKMITPFVKIKNPSTHKEATILSYARFLAFKFPDSMTVQIQCTVEVCRNGCAEACQRVPSSSATTIQPELSLTAKWPGSAHQPSFAGSNSRKPLPQLEQGDMANESQPKPSRVQFSNSRPSEISSNIPAQDDMRGMDSNNQHAIVHSSPFQQESRRLQPVQRAQPEIDGRIPQYLNPMVGSRRLPTQAPSYGAQRTVFTTSMATSTNEPSTTTTPSSPSLPTTSDLYGQSSTSGDGGEQPIDNSNGDESLSQSSRAGDQSGPNRMSESDVVDSIKANDNNKQSDQGKSDESGQFPPMNQNDKRTDTNDQGSDLNNNKPSVQGTDDIVEASPIDQSIPRPQDSDQVAAGSSIKTVEVEIPSNVDESSANRPDSNNQASSVSFSSGNMNFPDIPNASYEPSIGSAQLSSSSYQSQVIQPRESSQILERRGDKSRDDNPVDDSILNGHKVQFGARSVPSSQGQNLKSADVPQNPQSSQSSSSSADMSNEQYANHQSPPTSSNVNAIESANPADKVLMDRSDDGVGNEPMIASDSQDSKNIVKPDSDGLTESLDLDGGRVVRPVVGTDELATGTAQIENRMGSSFSKDSLEGEVIKLQQQIPQSAALVNPSVSQSSIQQSSNTILSQSNPNRNIDGSDMGETNKRLDAVQLNRITQSPSQGPSLSSNGQRDFKQPFPNVSGQSKIISDPSLLIPRGQMMAQASNQEPAFSPSIVSLQGASQPNPIQAVSVNKPINEQSRPVAQITNVPINIGFPQGQIPTLQQQQQQQQQQQSQYPFFQIPKEQVKPSTTTPRPSRLRFNLLSPQAALHAVASRILPKSFIQHQSQPQQHQQQNIQMQNQKLYQQFLQSQQQQQQQTGQLIHGQPIGSPANEPRPSNGRDITNQYVGLSQAQQPQMSHTLQQNQAPNQLFRSRRSVLESNGKRGSGEIGIKKSFMVITGVDLAFSPNSSDTELPPVLEGRRLDADKDVIYGVCMPVISLTFVLTCFFWLIVFLVTFSVYMIIKARRQTDIIQGSINEKKVSNFGY